MFFREDFSGGGGGRATWENLSREEFFMGKENFHEGGAGFPSII